MIQKNRREFLGTLSLFAGSATIATAFPPVIQKALAIPAHRRQGTLEDVEHIVILMQENRSFDHYFGTLPGVRGFADPFPLPQVWLQPPAPGTSTQAAIAPFHLNTQQNFEYMRVEGTPHSWNNAQLAWNHGRLNEWPKYKNNHSMGYFKAEDIPFQFALANAFTICDAYHCSFHGGTNPNRLFLWTGCNDGLAIGNGPATYNEYDSFDSDPGAHGGYTWITYAERLEKAGVTWQIYENMDDNFTDNPLAGFQNFRKAYYQKPGYSAALRQRGVSTRDLDQLADDVRNNQLPQVSWIVSTAEGSEHPGPSSPAQGADYISRVLEALLSNPEVFSKTVFLVNFDENDGFFDHIPPPAPPSIIDGKPYGASTVATKGEYHEHLTSYQNTVDEQALLHRPYGLGPRVPLYAISPWSKGGWVNSEVFDHTSVIKFIEKRFGVLEPNISPWRRAVCGDLLSVFNFARPDDKAFTLPATYELAQKARELTDHATPPVPLSLQLPQQAAGIRPSRALPYELQVTGLMQDENTLSLDFVNSGRAGAVFHVYDQQDKGAVPRRYTVEPKKSLRDLWPVSGDSYKLWLLGPNGFHRFFSGDRESLGLEIVVRYEVASETLRLTLVNGRSTEATFAVRANKYEGNKELSCKIDAGSTRELLWPLPNGPWYDLSVRVDEHATWSRRLAGRLESGRDSWSDPAMEGRALIEPSLSL